MSSEQIDDVFKCSDFDYSDGVNERNLLLYRLLISLPSSWEEPGETYIDYIVFTDRNFEARDRKPKVNGIIRRR
jgi:hypothetical protein